MKTDCTFLKGDGPSDFTTHAAPFVEMALTQAGLMTPDHRWSVVVRNAHKYGGGDHRPKSPEARVMQDHPATRTIHLRIRSLGINHYEATIHTSVSEHWHQTVERVRRAFAAAMEASSAAAALKPPAENKAQKPDGIDRIKKMRSGLDTVLAHAEEAEAVATLKAEAEARYEIAKNAASPVLGELDKASKELANCRLKSTENGAVLVTARKRLAEAEKRVAESNAEEEAALEKYSSLSARATPLRSEMEQAEAAVRECERQEAERAKELNAQPGMAALLKLLANLE